MKVQKRFRRWNEIFLFYLSFKQPANLLITKVEFSLNLVCPFHSNQIVLFQNQSQIFRSPNFSFPVCRTSRAMYYLLQGCLKGYTMVGEYRSYAHECTCVLKVKASTHVIAASEGRPWLAAPFAGIVW